MNVKFLTAAEKDLFNAVDYYNKQQLNLGFEFSDEVKRTIERIELIERLYFSLDSPDSRKHIDRLWAKEVEDRISAFENGELKAIPVKEVFEKIEIDKHKQNEP